MRAGAARACGALPTRVQWARVAVLASPRMAAKIDFKNALQALTTTLVKAEAAKGSDEAAFATLRAASVAQWQRVETTHAVLVAERHANGRGDKPLPHQGWYEQTVARVQAVFGALPSAAAADDAGTK
jgi:hypothetical protein